jgi:hypothetical protein
MTRCISNLNDIFLAKAKYDRNSIITNTNGQVQITEGQLKGDILKLNIK